MAFERLGKVKVQALNEHLLKLTMATVWFSTSGVHFERAIVELMKTHTVTGTATLHGDGLNSYYLLVFIA
jgi:hypothetical protein